MKTRRISIGVLLVMAGVALLVALWDFPEDLTAENLWGLPNSGASL